MRRSPNVVFGHVVPEAGTDMVVAHHRAVLLDGVAGKVVVLVNHAVLQVIQA
jgi:hypothetical protein